MAQGIKEITELLNGVKLLVVAGKGVAADGKVDIQDLQVVLGLVKDLNVLVEAVKGVDQIVLEAKDLDSVEGGVLLAKVFEIVNEIKK